ncbi:hypothetical protein [Streptomyces sp. NPDC101776]|uniref:hypothetical protein n=1 Tax=Streptomyces sp. NPDC101776 TaxID=3366146 RepID=UPI00382761CB
MDAYIESPKQAHISDSAVALLGTDQAVNGGRREVIDTSTARKWGYHPPEPSDDSETDNGSDEAKQSPGETEAYTGRSAKTGKALKGGTGSCAASARSQIFGKEGLKPALQYLLSYHENSFVVASREAEIRRAMSDWAHA